MLNIKTAENAETLKKLDKVNRLFLSWNCPNCIPIKDLLISNNIICNDDVNAKDGQSLSVFYTFNNTSTRDLLDYFDLIDRFTPVLLTWDKNIIENEKEIVNCLYNLCIIDK